MFFRQQRVGVGVAAMLMLAAEDHNHRPPSRSEDGLPLLRTAVGSVLAERRCLRFRAFDEGSATSTRAPRSRRRICFQTTT